MNPVLNGLNDKQYNIIIDDYCLYNYKVHNSWFH